LQFSGTVQRVICDSSRLINAWHLKIGVKVGLACLSVAASNSGTLQQRSNTAIVVADHVLPRVNYLTIDKAMHEFTNQMVRDPYGGKKRNQIIGYERFVVFSRPVQTV
jgi:hypothetical protein